MSDFKEKFKLLNEYEKNLSVFRYKFKDRPLWIGIREHLLWKFVGSHADFVRQKKFNFFRIISSLINIRKFFGNKVIFFMSERGLMEYEDNNYYSPYIDFIIRKENISEDNILILEIPNTFSDFYRKVIYKNYIPFDLYLFVRKIWSVFINKIYKSEVKRNFEPILKQIREIEQKEIKGLIYKITNFKFNLFFNDIFLKILKKINKEVKLYSFVSCFTHELDVIEIQHGMLNFFDPSFIFGEDFDYYTKKNKVIVFNEKSKKYLLESNYQPKNVEFYINPRITSFYRSYEHDELKIIENKILIITQPNKKCREIINNLVNILNKEEENLKEYEFMILMHPADNISKYNFDNNKKVQILEKYNLYKLLMENIFVISAYSTVMEEGKHFGDFLIYLRDGGLYKNCIDYFTEKYDNKKVLYVEEIIDFFIKNKKDLIKFKRDKKIIIDDYIKNMGIYD